MIAAAEEQAIITNTTTNDDHHTRRTNNHHHDNLSAEDAKEIVAKAGDNKFLHICLYNSLVKTENTFEGIEALMAIYGNLLGLHGFMAGFQYVALENQIDIDEDDSVDSIELAIFSLRYFGFLTSLAGTLICIIIGEYLKTIQYEEMTTQVKGLVNYANFIQMADYSALLATVILAATSNLLLWKNSIPLVLSILYNVLAAIGGLMLLRAFIVIIVKKQPERLLYEDDNYKAALILKKSRTLWQKITGAAVVMDDE